MKIAVVTPSYPPYKGGMGNVAYNFVKTLKDRNHDVTVFTPGYTKTMRSKKMTGVKVLVPLAYYGNAAFLPQLYFKLLGFDVIHVHVPFIGVGAVLIWFKMLHPNTRLIIHYHMDLVGKGLFKPLFWLYAQTIIRLLLKNATTIIVTSQDYANTSILQSSFLKYAYKIRVVANGIHYKYFSRHIHNDRVSSLVPYILFVGGLDSAHYFKGISILLKSWEMIHKDFTKENLIIIGDGNMRLHYEKKKSLLESRKSIYFVGRVSDDDLVAYYENACATVLPSVTRSEAFGMVLIESMASGTPVLASNLPGVRTLVKESKTGWLVEPSNTKALADGLLIAIKESDRLKKNNEMNAFAKQFDWETLTDTLEEIVS